MKVMMGLVQAILALSFIMSATSLPMLVRRNDLQGAGLPKYPLYLQCDKRWGNDEMGTPGEGERSTICGEGCAMSCVAMGLAGNNITIEGATATPATLNAWLEANQGYTCAGGDCNNLVLNKPDAISSRVHLVGEFPKPAFSDLCSSIMKGNYLAILHVHNRGHFVLATGCNTADQSFNVNDPFYPTTSYAYADVADIIAYTVDAE
uniref:Peptidase C39-like domain-containing protein n=1 Tax=Palpitomonas bilix TaxID=652834 RepID=A0A7S3DAZ2_9EUKA|mmetsp:Transcript_29865/g.77086  ORF Transcript_29865/g.77086 Transcript_29865/m.77086 type:complete len:206 (+) Transcript_29865:47-664(+)